MNKLDQNTKDKLHFWWFIVAVICVIITYYWMKSRATSNYEEVLKVASKSCNLAVIEFSVKNLLDVNARIPELTALHYASGAGCLEVVKFLTKEGADINAAKYERWTALHSAAYKGNLEIISFLLEKGANPKIRSKDGKNPRDVAVLRSRHNKDKPYDEIIKLLANAEDKFQAN
ncbi:ankyrin repeat domain-containing protein [Wolbachia endosymbiont of Ctenocephalides felis wCfeT]|uniref:ankyrin repeat domain-containing protein n=1 Tax=Wolbachia endosymbiont of Ctenocephalides felis wCfeT TaxID=2732593 RepID=UPI001448819C|nr:ankyrin repeat domain-containing protein [Wolbachia endosymbiont of Ctenocephalides felis wCfeT]